MRHGIVEGEPGVFPAPVAKVMRTIGGLFGRKKKGSGPGSGAQPTPPPGDIPSWSDLDPKAPSGAQDDPDQPPAAT